MSTLWAISPTINASVALHSYALEPSWKHTAQLTIRRGNPTVGKQGNTIRCGPPPWRGHVDRSSCGTSDGTDTASKSGDSSKDWSSTSIQGFDTSSIQKDDEIAALLPDSVAGDGTLTVGTNLPMPRPSSWPRTARPRSALMSTCQGAGRSVRTEGKHRLLHVRFDYPVRRLQVRHRHLLLHRDQGTHGGCGLRDLLQGRFHVRGARATRTRSIPRTCAA